MRSANASTWKIGQAKTGGSAELPAGPNWPSRKKIGGNTVESPFYDTGLGVGAITGGTGTYVGASGSLDLSCTETECTFKFNLS